MNGNADEDDVEDALDCIALFVNNKCNEATYSDARTCTPREMEKEVMAIRR